MVGDWLLGLPDCDELSGPGKTDDRDSTSGKQAGVLARAFLQESQILIPTDMLAACSHIHLVTGLRFFRLALWLLLLNGLQQVLLH